MRGALLHAARDELALTGPGGISLRAIARRAGVSHAAPKHHFGDRSGLLTALAVDGYRELARVLLQATSEPHANALGAWAALGRAYVAAALAAPEVFALMFRPELLHRDNPDLVQAQREALAPLARLAGARSGGDDEPSGDDGARGGGGDGGGDGSDGSDGGDGGASSAGGARGAAPDLALMAWSFAHGVAMLARDGALQAAAQIPPTDTDALTTRLTDQFARWVIR